MRITVQIVPFAEGFKQNTFKLLGGMWVAVVMDFLWIVDQLNKIYNYTFSNFIVGSW